MSKSMQAQAGFTLVTTLFLLVVVSSLGAYMVNLATVQHSASALSVSALRARYALTSGLEWSYYRIQAAGVCPSVPSELNIDGYRVRLTACSADSVTEGLESYQMFDVSLTAERGSYGDMDYVQRRVQALLKVNS